jgi:hypothetical protein
VVTYFQATLSELVPPSHIIQATLKHEAAASAAHHCAGPPAVHGVCNLSPAPSLRLMPPTAGNALTEMLLC